MYTPGPIADFNRFPAIWGWGAATGPLLFNPAALTQTPEIYRVGVGRLVTFRQWGHRAGVLAPGVANLPARDWAKGPDQPWGMGRETALLDDYDKFQAPAAAAEKLQMFDRQRCQTFSAAVTPEGAAFELIRFDIPAQTVGVVERIPTTLQVEALDAGGLPVFAYSNTNGELPCLERLDHPDPAVVLPLQWQWRVTTTDNGPPSPYIGPINPASIIGDDLVEPWSDMRNGHAERWPDELQYVLHPRKTVRFWITVFGPPGRFRVTAGARIGGFWQTAGRYGAALKAAIVRF